MKKPAGQERTAAERNYAAKATRRRRRIPPAGFSVLMKSLTADKCRFLITWIPCSFT